MHAKIFFWVALIILTGVPAPADIYKWVDKNGVVHFSNTDPAADADFMTSVESPSAGRTKIKHKMNQKKSSTQAKLAKRSTENSSRSKKTASSPKPVNHGPYHFYSWSAYQSADNVRVRGKVSGGAPCRRLRVKVTLENTEGRLKSVTCYGDDVNLLGYGSKFVSGSEPVSTAKSDWTVTDFTEKCIQKP
jgi:hypothetical protein